MKSFVSKCCIVITLFALATGCDDTPEGRLRVYSTSGSVTVDGQPAEGVKIVLIGNTPDIQGDGTAAPYGVTDADGKFVLTSFVRNDGSPAGEFKVTAFWASEIPEGVDEEMFEPTDRLGEKYVSADKTELTITVPEGGGELPTIALTTK